jgi:hypothetical protein
MCRVSRQRRDRDRSQSGPNEGISRIPFPSSGATGSPQIIPVVADSLAARVLQSVLLPAPAGPTSSILSGVRTCLAGCDAARVLITVAREISDTCRSQYR